MMICGTYRMGLIAAMITVILAQLCLFGSGQCEAAAEGQIGTIAFGNARLTPEEIDFLKGFKIVVTGNFSDTATTEKLRAMNAKLIYYDWLPGLYYCEKNEAWAEEVYANRFAWTLDPEKSDPDPMGSRWGCMDLFYDMANDELIEARARYLADLIKGRKYDGVFFDWGAGWNDLVEKKYTFVTDEFSRRHPGVSYDQKASEFIKKLKDRGLMVVMNCSRRELC